MKIRRHKHVKKLMSFYRNNFKIKPPYQVLVDGTFCRAGLKFKINIGEQLPKYLAGEVELLTTACAIKECEVLGTLLYGPLKLLRQYRLVPCRHSKSRDGVVTAAACFHSLAKRPDCRYFFATQDKSLSEKLRSMTGRPLLYMAYNAIHLESPATASQAKAESVTAAKLEVTENQQNALIHASKSLSPGVSDNFIRSVVKTEKEPIKKKRRGPKGPNPLSCKKSKKKAQQKKKNQQLKKEMM